MDNTFADLAGAHVAPLSLLWTNIFSLLCEFSNTDVLITAHVRSTTGRLCFDTCVSIHLSVHRGGAQVQPGGVRSRRRGGGVRSSRGGGQVQTGASGPDGGGQVQPVGGGGQVQLAGGGSGPAGGGGQVQPARGGWSGPTGGGEGSGPGRGGSGPAGGGVGGSAKIGQHREYLLHGGRYASCVHAGGLSC